jgi:hypothetical protein
MQYLSFVPCLCLVVAGTYGTYTLYVPYITGPGSHMSGISRVWSLPCITTRNPAIV